MRKYNSPFIEIKDFEDDVVIMSNGGFVKDLWEEDVEDFVFSI